MGSISDFAENALLDHVLNSAYTPSSTVYLALSTSDPLDDGSGLSEPGDTYARQSISFGTAASRRVTQDADVTYPEATGSWGTITHYAVMDASTGGNLLAHGAFSSSFSPVRGNTPSVSSGEVYVQIDSSSGYGLVDWLVHRLLDLMFRNAAEFSYTTSPGTYCALASATISDTDTTITELSDSSYSRIQVNPSGGASPAWNLAASGSVDNANDIIWAVGTGGFSTFTSLAIMDASTAGNLLAYDNDNVVDQSANDGDTVKFPASDLTVSLS